MLSGPGDSVTFKLFSLSKIICSLKIGSLHGEWQSLGCKFSKSKSKLATNTLAKKFPNSSAKIWVPALLWPVAYTALYYRTGVMRCNICIICRNAPRWQWRVVQRVCQKQYSHGKQNFVTSDQVMLQPPGFKFLVAPLTHCEDWLKKSRFCPSVTKKCRRPNAIHP